MSPRSRALRETPRRKSLDSRTSRIARTRSAVLASRVMVSPDQAHGGVNAAEVVALGDLLGALVDGVVHLLAVEAGDDVEGGVVGHGGSPFRGGDFSRPESRWVVL